MSHPGIRLRISCHAGTLFEADSDLLHYLAAMRMMGREWFEIFPGEGNEFAGGHLRIQAQAVELADDYPDDDDYERDGWYCDCLCSNCSGCLGGWTE
jgi:hypothetical protein